MDLWDTMKRNNIHIMGIPEEKETESIFRAIMAKNFQTKHPDTTGPNDPKQDESKESYTNTHYD